MVVGLEIDAVDARQVGALEQRRLGALDVADDEVDALVAQQRVEVHRRHLDGADVGVRRRRERTHPEVAAQVEGGARDRRVGQDRVDPADLAHPVQGVQPRHVVEQVRVGLDREHLGDPALPRQQRRDEADAGADLEHPVAGTDDRGDLARLLGLEAAGEDGPADRRGDDGGIVRDQDAGCGERDAAGVRERAHGELDRWPGSANLARQRCLFSERIQPAFGLG